VRCGVARFSPNWNITTWRIGGGIVSIEALLDELTGPLSLTIDDDGFHTYDGFHTHTAQFTVRPTRELTSPSRKTEPNGRVTTLCC
jgi:hypothetical protein